MTYAKQALDALNNITTEMIRSESWWHNYVSPLEGYDGKTTEMCDSANTMEVVAFTDGSVAEVRCDEWVESMSNVRDYFSGGYTNVLDDLGLDSITIENYVDDVRYVYVHDEDHEWVGRPEDAWHRLLTLDGCTVEEFWNVFS